jgi:hypothetical protein
VVTALAKYSTISVPADIKNLLEKAKGDNEWGEYLVSLYAEAKRLKSKKAFDELAKTLTDKDLNVIRESSKELRERFKLR